MELPIGKEDIDGEIITDHIEKTIIFHGQIILGHIDDGIRTFNYFLTINNIVKK